MKRFLFVLAILLTTAVAALAQKEFSYPIYVSEMSGYEKTISNDFIVRMNQNGSYDIIAYLESGKVNMSVNVKYLKHYPKEGWYEYTGKVTLSDKTGDVIVRTVQKLSDFVKGIASESHANYDSKYAIGVSIRNCKIKIDNNTVKPVGDINITFLPFKTNILH